MVYHFWKEIPFYEPPYSLESYLSVCFLNLFEDIINEHVGNRMDEPLMWGILPAAHFLRARPMRWSLGASDICFTNPYVRHLLRVHSYSSTGMERKERFFSEFFRQGQVLETFRGNGIRQHAVDRSIELLNQGEWVSAPSS